MRWKAAEFLMRISYKIIQLTGGTYKGLIVGLAILGLIFKYYPIRKCLCNTSRLGLRIV